VQYCQAQLMASGAAIARPSSHDVGIVSFSPLQLVPKFRLIRGVEMCHDANCSTNLFP
jgi:hypothetical protein